MKVQELAFETWKLIFPFYFFSVSSSVIQDIDEILKGSLLPARDRLERLLAELREIADTVDKIHRGATIAKITGGSVGIAGGITAIVGLCLAPVTFGASLIVSVTGLAVATAGGLTSATATGTDIGTSHVKKKTTEQLLNKCQEELEHIQEYTRSISEKCQILKGYGDKDLKSAVAQIGSGAGRVVLNAIKMAEAGQLLLNAGRIARFAGAATGVLTALALGFDIFFLAKDSMEYHKGAKSELAGKIREAAKDIEQVIDHVDQFCRELTAYKQE
ncbi:apolipoprotein L domain-containing protein 1-like [Emydura macquarii macquarii]|uniref:apolipoprotein L domain-containing protein 1-like n=1 Tax=Emydura macquarii macquarii TaxID=1129001 RepID=UPI00352A5365